MSMTRSIVRASVFGLVLLASPLGPVGAWAAPKTTSLKAIQTMVDGLGLEDTSDKKTQVEIGGKGKYAITIYVLPLDDGSTLSIGTSLGEIPADKIAAMPAERMLEFNDTHFFHFIIGETGASKTLFFNAVIDASTLTPQLLRQKIDDLTATADEGNDLWNQDNWKTPARPDAFKISSLKGPDGKFQNCEARWSDGFSLLFYGDDMVMSAASDQFKFAKDEAVKGDWSIDGGTKTSFATTAKEANTATINLPITDDNFKKLAAAGHFDVTANGATAHYGLADFYKAFVGIPVCVNAAKPH